MTINVSDHFHSVKGISIDCMHGTLLGVQKLLSKLWLTPTYSLTSAIFVTF